MANWIHKLDVSKHWKTADETGDFIPLARDIIKKLKAIKFGGDFDLERDDLVREFELLIDDKDATIDDFDSLFLELYDFADTPLDDKFNGKKLMWVETF
jgi:hypothetical protein